MGATRVLLSQRLHDDTEEDLVGASWHQQAIRATAISIDDVAVARVLPWVVGDQLTLVATKPDGTAWRPSPDVMVYAQGGRGPRAEMIVATDGLPTLVIEVLSPSTWTYDVDVQGGKAWGYLRLGVPFYLAFDPYETFQGRSCQGWRQDDGTVRAWLPEPDGRHHVPGLGISFQPEQDLLRVYDPDGRRVPFFFETASLLRLTAAERDAQTQRAEEERRRADALAQRAAEQAQQLEEERGRIAALEVELARLRTLPPRQEDTDLSW
jgi:Uma2 family endonuclease